MIRPSALLASGALALFAAGALAQSAAFDVRAAMQQRVNPAMLEIWDVSNNALDEGEITMAAVQKHLDRDPAAFRQMARALAEHADHIALPARAGRRGGRRHDRRDRCHLRGVPRSTLVS